jgi:hypothetical protein
MSEVRKREPNTDELHVGIEIEFKLRDELRYYELQDALRKHPLENKIQIFHEMLTWNIRGYEATILAPQDAFEEPLRACLDLLAGFDPYVDKDCGSHVHLDCRVRSKISLRELLYASRSKLWGMVAPYREGHPGAGFVCDRGYQTLEVRCSESHFDFDRHVKWIKTLTALADNAASKVQVTHVITPWNHSFSAPVSVPV